MTRWKPDARGRLMHAAMDLYGERGFDNTTVAAIAERAGLTERTFFRHFADKREVLFWGSEELEALIVTEVRAAPESAAALDAVAAALDAAAATAFEGRREQVTRRQQIIVAHPELQERELIKLQNLAGAIKAALVERGVSANAAILASQAGVTVFHVGFAHWVEQDDPTALPRLIDESLDDLRSLTAA